MAVERVVNRRIYTNKYVKRVICPFCHYLLASFQYGRGAHVQLMPYEPQEFKISLCYITFRTSYNFIQEVNQSKFLGESCPKPT